MKIFVADDSGTTRTLINNADIAMYHTKALGINNYQFFNEDINKRNYDHLNLESALKSAMEHRELYLKFQLEILLKNGCTEGQGYLFCKPFNADTISELLQNHRLIAVEVT